MNHIALSVTAKSDRYPIGRFQATLYLKGKNDKTKSAALHIHEADLAYEMVHFWAQEKVNEFGCKYEPVSMSALVQRIENPETPRINYTKSKTKVSNIWHNKKYFKIALRNVFNEVGYDILEAVLSEGLKELESLNKIAVSDRKAKSHAKSMMAQSLFNIYNDTNVDMSESITDKDVLAEYNKLILTNK